MFQQGVLHHGQEAVAQGVLVAITCKLQLPQVILCSSSWQAGCCGKIARVLYKCVCYMCTYICIYAFGCNINAEIYIYIIYSYKYLYLYLLVLYIRNGKYMHNASACAHACMYYVHMHACLLIIISIQSP